MEFSTHSLIWAIINFVVFLALLRLFLYRPVLRLLDARREEIQNNLAQAEAARREADEARAQHERQLAKARDEAQAILARAEAAAEKAREEIVGQAQRQAVESIERAKKAIAAERDRALDEIRREVADLAVMAASRVIERSLDVDQHRQLVADLVKKVPETGGSRAGPAT